MLPPRHPRQATMWSLEVLMKFAQTSVVRAPAGYCPKCRNSLGRIAWSAQLAEGALGRPVCTQMRCGWEGDTHAV
jgi:hypothetical protein